MLQMREIRMFKAVSKVHLLLRFRRFKHLIVGPRCNHQPPVVRTNSLMLPIQLLRTLSKVQQALALLVRLIKIKIQKVWRHSLDLLSLLSLASHLDSLKILHLRQTLLLNLQQTKSLHPNLCFLSKVQARIKPQAKRLLQFKILDGMTHFLWIPQEGNYYNHKAWALLM